MSHSMSRILLAFPLVITLAGAVRADAVSDALQAALDAYNAGDLGATSASMTAARQLLDTQQGALLAALMPAAPEGWTATPNADFVAGMATLGGGAGAETTYAKADQSVSFTVTFFADNTLVSSMAQMLGNAEMMAIMGKVVKVGDQTLLDTDGNLSGLINDRVLVQAQGAPTDALLPVIQAIDFTKLGKFDAK